MSNLIKQLPASVIKKIAAGEVIDRPDAVVKELIENALDAEATKLEIYLTKGGLKKIEVRDNGLGMSEADLRQSFLPHTTSKITELSDLETIKSYGFRGEALASMVEVAKVTLASRPQNEALGYQLVIKNGQVIEAKKIGMPVGTRVLVENLFSGIPARKKFINNVQRELTYVLKRITNSALVNFKTQYVLFHDDKKLFEVFKQKNLIDRAKEIFGTELVEQSLVYEQQFEHVKVSGLIGKPQLSLRSPARQYLFINGRPIRHRKLAKVIRDAYGSLLEPKAYPTFIIYLDLPSYLFDTNIHPRKEEVLLFKEDSLVSSLFENLQQFLLAKDLTYILKTENNLTGYLLRDRATTDRLKENLTTGWRVEQQENTIGEILQFQKTYLFFELNGELMVVDQHAAHEMILYQDYLTQFNKQELLKQKKVEVKQKINLTKENYYIFSQNQTIFSKLGFIFSLSHDELVIEQVSSLFANLDLERVIMDLLDDVANYGKIVKPDLLTNRALSFLACRSAIKAGDYLTVEQRENIVKKLLTESMLYTCPHGRPLKIKISQHELEKMFFRRK